MTHIPGGSKTFDLSYCVFWLIPNESQYLPPARVFDSEFRDTAKGYLSTPSNEKMDEYPPNNEAKATPVGDKSTANLANIVAIAQSSSSKTKTTAQRKTKSKAKPKPKPTKKKKQNRRTSTAKKMTTFKILRKRKWCVFYVS